jgi:uncharacterized protein YndB with AHSA1/START domain
MTDAPESENRPEVSITRTFDAAPAAVFASWTEPERFAQWFGGAGVTVTDVVMDVRTGGEWHARMVLGGGAGDIPWRGAYLEVDPPHRLVFTLADRPGNEFERVTVDLTEIDGKTEMVFTQSGGHMDAEGYAQAEEGWRAFFVDLDASLVSAPPSAGSNHP